MCQAVNRLENIMPPVLTSLQSKVSVQQLGAWVSLIKSRGLPDPGTGRSHLTESLQGWEGHSRTLAWKSAPFRSCSKPEKRIITVFSYIKISEFERERRDEGDRNLWFKQKGFDFTHACRLQESCNADFLLFLKWTLNISVPRFCHYFPPQEKLYYHLLHKCSLFSHTKDCSLGKVFLFFFFFSPLLPSGSFIYGCWQSPGFCSIPPSYPSVPAPLLSQDTLNLENWSLASVFQALPCGEQKAIFQVAADRSVGTSGSLHFARFNEPLDKS